jgi:hypothetical protein
MGHQRGHYFTQVNFSLIDANSSQIAPRVPEAAPFAAPASGIKKIRPISEPQNAPTAVALSNLPGKSSPRCSGRYFTLSTGGWRQSSIGGWNDGRHVRGQIHAASTADAQAVEAAFTARLSQFSESAPTSTRENREKNERGRQQPRSKLVLGRSPSSANRCASATANT